MNQDELNEDAAEWTQELPPPSKNVRIVIEGPASDSVALASLASLLLGGATEGSEQFLLRLKQWQANTDSQGQAIYSESPDETEQERLRYALIGLLVQAPGIAQGAVSTALDVSDSLYGAAARLLMPVTSSRAARPLRRRYNTLAARGETIVEKWIDTGRSAEQRSRALARQAAFEGTDEAMNEVIGIMAVKPEVRDLITQQGVGMAGEVMGAVREQTAIADTHWERRIRRLFRRS